jgi:rare lipoprotein A
MLRSLAFGPLALLTLILLLAGCTGSVVGQFEGEASYYSKSLDGKPTASGEPYRHWGMSAAHKKLPFGTYVRVTNKANGRQATVVINDRGPYAKNRVIDLSGGAAKALGMIDSGTARVLVEILE